MADWKTDLNALVEETGALTNRVQAKASFPPAVVEPTRLPPVNWIGGALREEIAQRVAKFKAHQQRLIRERGDFAASEWKRVQAVQPSAEEHPAPSKSTGPEGA